MRRYFATSLIVLSSLSFAHAADVDQFLSKYNKIFNGEIAVCDSNKAVSHDKSGYHLAEATLIDGSKAVMRVPQNTLGKLKKDGDNFVAEFHSYRWEKSNQTSRTEKNFLKLEMNAEGLPRLNMYDKNMNFQAGHAIGDSEDGSIEFISSETTPFQIEPGLKNVDKGAKFYFYVIRASKVDGEIIYIINDVFYDVSNEMQLKIEKETGKKFFTDSVDQVGNRYRGNSFTVEEVRQLAAKFGFESKEDFGQPWKSCPLPSKEEILDYQSGIAKNGKSDKGRLPSSKPKAKKK